MNSLVHRFGQTIRVARKQRGWTQEQLAEASHLNRSYVGEIERGLAVPSLETIDKLATALGLSPATLLGRCE